MAPDSQQRMDYEEDDSSWAGDFDPFADPDERRVLFAALDSFRQFRRMAHMNTTHRRRQAFYALPSSHWQMLAEPPFSLLENFIRVDDAIDANAEISDAILMTGLKSFGLPAEPAAEDPRHNWHETATHSDVNKAHSTIRQFYRDWSVEGRIEREVCYDPVLQDLKEEFGNACESTEDIKVLVPGAGLGRLVFEICQEGFSAEGNEISYHQLLASSWVLNHTLGPQQHALYPFALQFSNLRSRRQQLKKVMIPDVHPGSAMMESQTTGTEGAKIRRPFGSMNMSAADFMVLYSSPSNKDAFDAVATVFFIDTAPNLIRYVETIRQCLKPNGVWINVGPLLWHFEDGSNHLSQNHSSKNKNTDNNDHERQGLGEPGNVELTEEEVFQLVERMGFRIEKCQPVEERSRCGYIQDPASMLQNVYQPSHWMARKVCLAA